MIETRFQQDPAILEARDVRVRFGGLEALNKLSFSVAPHQIVSIIGPNGAGKTTFLNAVTGVYALESGEILFRGKPISTLKPFQIAAVGIHRTFQQPQLFSNLTVLENVMVGLHANAKSGFWEGMLHLPRERREEKSIRAKSERLLDFFDLRARAGFMTSQISVAEQKRTEIARAVASDPEILLLDEPVAGLNLCETDAMGALIVRLKEKGYTILIVEHNMNLVMEISDWIVVLHHGEKIGEGRPQEVQGDRRVIEAYLGA